MKVIEKLNLKVSQFEIDFVNIDLDIDTPLYIDPFLIANSNSPWAINADKTIKNFFNTFKTFMLKRNYDKVYELFSFMSEPKETCLGVSKTGTKNGRGVGEFNTKEIVDWIIKSNAIERNLIKNIEDIILFVDNIDRDKLSDMTTNIIRKELIDYTKAQCDLWGIKLIEGETLPFWSATNGYWANTDEDLLLIDGSNILLTPKAIVSPIDIYHVSKYEWYYIFEQERQNHLARRSSLVKYKTLKGGRIRPYLPKIDVKNDIKDQIDRGGYTNFKDYVRQYTHQQPKVFTQFTEASRRLIASLSNKLIGNKTSDDDINEIIDKLIERLKKIPTGKEHASRYHHYIRSLLEILWYPYLMNPIIEREIHDGRKRIDIVMDNNAKDGFFFKLHNISKIFCPYIYIECKNYESDIANPEIDQLSGRFSTSRGMFGLLVCRNLANQDVLKKRCQDTYVDGRGLIICLTDEDIIHMLEALKTNDMQTIWGILDNKKRDIMI